MAFHILRFLMFFASGLIVGVGLCIFLLGPDFTATLALDIIAPSTAESDPIVAFETSNVDSELRFFAPFFISYGVLVYLCAKHLRTHLYYVPHLLAIFAIGGVGRLLSYMVVGQTHPLFFYLMIIELGAPMILFLLYKRAVAKLSQI